MFSRRLDPLASACRALVAAAMVLGCDGGSLTGAGTPGAADGVGGLGSQRDPQTLIVGRAADAIFLDPARPTDNESVEVISQLFDTLIRANPRTGALEPGLATRWSVSERGRVWTFTLREGVTFHDGTPMDADAVVFSFERQRDPFHPFHRNDYNYWQNVYTNIEKVEKVDDRTVRITIERSYAPFEASMSVFPVAIVSPTAVERWGGEFASHPVGTGPFKFVAWEKASRIVLERNPDYWGERANMARLVFQVIRDPRHRLIALESGAIDVAQAILPEELQFVALHPELVLHQNAANNVTYLAMNTTHPPFDDVRVRRAVNYAINKEPLVKLAYQGLAIPADGPLPPTQWGYHRSRASYGYEPEKARALLAEAAADGRFDPDQVYTLYAPLDPRPYLFKPEQVARVLAANLRDVGVRTRLVLQPFHNHVSSVQQSKHDLCLLGWVGDNGDPDNFLYTLFDRDNTVPGSARNVAFFRDPELHGLLVMARESENRAERERIYARVQELIAREAPWVPLAHSQVVVAVREDVGGVVVTPQGHISYKDVRRIDR